MNLPLPSVGPFVLLAVISNMWEVWFVPGTTQNKLFVQKGLFSLSGARTVQGFFAEPVYGGKESFNGGLCMDVITEWGSR
jgi:hypothetical protein